ncbi:MFS transporter [Labrys wisconsinensis]|uniref:DHA2 family multidrug resistance protein-like MFS transporter n=1 Tax=Labrys wisconsinensis TaxID=425677 RepID=A0ABU0JJ40_9HYPH|nr:MFS transporter [Labrys wisconsinensis]MDQ0473625.1 DHA2 family multidrug resistance protein-like MFS transporter [Labrys wisconsinensis]
MPDGLPHPQRAWAFLAVAIALTMAVLDGAIVNVALPSIARDLHVEAPEAIWVVNAYQLAVTMSLLPLASLGDIFGYRRIYCWGLALFTLASLLCALSPSLSMLTAARALQGLGGAGIMSVNIALVRFIYPSAMIGRGVGNTALVVAVSAAAGPTVGAAILAVAPWQWLFLVNVPLGVLALAVASRTLPLTPRSGGRFDVVSAVLSAATFGLLIYGVDGIGRGGGPAPAWLPLVAAAAFGAVLARRQLAMPQPLLPVDLMRIPIFALSMATSICAFGSQMLLYVSLPFYFQNQLGLSAVATGFLMTPWPVATALMSPIAGRLSDHYPAGLLGGLGLAVMTVGLVLLVLLPAHPALADIAWRLAVCGLGFGLFQSPNNKTIITSAPPQRSGGASGMQSTARLLGQSMGAALAAVIFALAGSRDQAYAAILVGVALSAAGAVVSALRGRPVSAIN